VTQRNYHSHESREEDPKPVPIFEKPSFWVAWQPIISMFLLLLGGLAWGLKLESEVDSLVQQMFEIRLEIKEGILPIAKERISAMADKIETIRSQQIVNIQGLQDLRDDIGKMSNEAAKGVLPVTEERMRGMAERIEVIRSQQIVNIQGLQDLRDDIGKLSHEVFKFSSQLNKREGKGN